MASSVIAGKPHRPDHVENVGEIHKRLNVNATHQRLTGRRAAPSHLESNSCR